MKRKQQKSSKKSAKLLVKIPTPGRPDMVAYVATAIKVPIKKRDAINKSEVPWCEFASLNQLQLVSHLYKPQNHKTVYIDAFKSLSSAMSEMSYPQHAGIFSAGYSEKDGVPMGELADISRVIIALLSYSKERGWDMSKMFEKMLKTRLIKKD